MKKKAMFLRLAPRVLIRLFFLGLLLVSVPTALRAEAPIPWDNATQGGFVTCLCADNTGHLWIGTEGKGVWRYGPDARPGYHYLHFTHANGLGDDNVYALTCDKWGRVWVGTLNHGVSVFNGSAWRTYAPPYGPLGCRVFALAASPVSGDLWIATEAGLTRYAFSKSFPQGAWTHYTRGDGLPSAQPDALAFGQDGTLYVGTQCDGIAIGSPRDEYHTWRVVSGPTQMPNTPSGEGLPSALVNCLLAARDGAIYAGTICGLARSRDGGATWQYVRGADWWDKVKGLWHGPTPQEKGPFPATLLEDYVTCLAEDGGGRLAVGHRQKGMEIWDTKTQTRLVPAPDAPPAPAFAAAVLPWRDGAFLTGCYEAGLKRSALPEQPEPTRVWTGTPEPIGVPVLPQPAEAPTLAELNALAAQVASVLPNPKELDPHVTALADDWRTEGDWLGRYGRYWACLCATFHPIPQDYLWGAGWEPVQYAMRMGPNQPPGDSLRYWLQTRYTADPRLLELPPTYLHSRVLKGYTTWNVNRRDTSVDDHGETYPMAMDGPGIDTTVTVPDGLFYLSLYEMNAQNGACALRDFRLSVRAHVGGSLDDITGFDRQPELARGRVRDYVQGVYKRFLVRGPLTLTIEINRSNSWNTALCGIMLDLPDEDPAPYFQTVTEWNARESARAREAGILTQRPPVFLPAGSEAQAASRLFDELNEKRLTNSVWWATEGARYYAPLLRWQEQQAQMPENRNSPRLQARLGTCCYALGLYPEWESHQKASGMTTARQIEKSLRWDCLTDSYSGLGYDVVAAHLAAQSGQQESKSF